MSRSREDGFGLVEILVSIVVGIAVVVGIGILGERLIGYRAANGSNWDAVRLAEREVEQLRSLANPATAADLAAGAHGPLNVSRDGQPALGPYAISWTVTDACPLAGSKCVTVSVSHASDPRVRASLATYLVLPVS